jgi:hypothetical protein
MCGLSRKTSPGVTRNSVLIMRITRYQIAVLGYDLDVRILLPHVVPMVRAENGC